MSRKKGGSGGALVVAVAAILGLLSKIPGEAWVLLVAVVVVVIVIRAMSGSRESPTRQNAILGITPPFKKTWAYRTESQRAPVRTSTSVGSTDRLVPPPPSGEAAFKARWVPKDETLRIAGLELSGGMIYAGLSLKAQNGQQEPALINPNLRVHGTSVDVSERKMPYWPSYSEVTPEARRAYLQWLSTGRKDPSADVGYVFLYFYGLERRVLVDLASAPTSPEIKDIDNEVRRLLGIYSNSGSFRNYANSFLDYLSSGNCLPTLDSPPPSTPDRGYELPLTYRLALAQFASTRRPLPSDWALGWTLVDPSINCRTPAQRCPDQFKRLFVKEYTAAFGDGLLLPINKTKLRVSYRPASGGFLGSVVSRDMGNLPEVGAMTGPQAKLQELVNRCTDQLDRYSRFIGRNPERPHVLEAIVLLPVDVWPESAARAVQELKQQTNETELLIPWHDVLNRFMEDQSLTRSAATQLATQLETAGISVEPDLISGARIPDPEDEVALFSSGPRNQTILNSAAYAAAAVTLDFGCMAAASDQSAHDLEIQHLLNAIEKWADLDDSARRRLRARLRLGIKQPTSLGVLRKKVEALSDEARTTIANLLVEVVKADGLVDAAEVKLLESAYKLLQLDPKAVYSALHGAGTSRQTMPARGLIALDSARIAHLQQETKHIAVVLNEVFAEELPAPITPIESGENGEPSRFDLLLDQDKEYAPFARLLLSRPRWSRAELTDAALDMGLMLDGALERINDAAFEKYGGAIAEGADPVEVDQTLMERVVA